MADIDNLFGKAISEIERMLNTKTVVGEPITVEGNTLIPLISVGFGFGVGAGEGTDPKKGGWHRRWRGWRWRRQTGRTDHHQQGRRAG